MRRRTLSLARIAEDFDDVLNAARFLSLSLSNMTLAHDALAEREAIASLSSLLEWLCIRHRHFCQVVGGEAPPRILAGAAFEVEPGDDAAEREVCVSWSETTEPVESPASEETSARATAPASRPAKKRRK